VQSPQRQDRLGIAVSVGGAVGDNVMAARFLRDLGAVCPDLAFDVYTSNVVLGKWIYQDVAAVRDCFQDVAFNTVYTQYDVALFFGDTMKLLHHKATDGWSKEFSAIAASIARFSEAHKEAPEFPYNHDGVVAQDLFYKHGLNRARANHFIADIPYGGDRYRLPADEEIISKHSLSERRFVTVHNGYDLSTVAQTGSATKVYPRFGEVIKELRKSRPELVFIQIGASTSVVIDEVDINLVGQTNLRQAAALVKAAACHVDNESGLVTIASCYGTPCCVVYGPSSADYFTYEGNATIRPVQCGGCWWIAKDWMSRCPREMNQPVCMYSQPPGRVAEAVIGLLNAKKG
jgi:hypothetical protein